MNEDILFKVESIAYNAIEDLVCIVEEKGITTHTLAANLHWHEKKVRRLLNGDDISLQDFTSVAHHLGMDVDISLKDTSTGKDWRVGL